MTHARPQARAILFLTALSLGLLALAWGPSPTLADLAQANQGKVDEKTIRDLIQQLGDDSFDKREDAAKKLASIGEPALALLQQAAKDNSDAEIRTRAGQLVNTVLQAVGSKDFFVVKTFRPAIDHGPVLRRVVLTPDGKQFVISGKGPPTAWDIATGKELEPVQGGKGNICFALAISPDGKQVIIGCNGKMGHVFDLPTGRKMQLLTGHTAAIRGVALLADGKTALTGGFDPAIRVWDLETGRETRQFNKVTDNVSCLAVSADGKTLAAGHFTKAAGPATVRLWDVEQGAEIRALPGHAQEVTNVAFSPDGKSLLSSSRDRTVRLWEVETGKELKRFVGQTGAVENAAFTPDGKRVVSSGDDQDPSLRLWDIESGKQILQSGTTGGAITGLAVLPDSRHCVTAGKDGVIRLWEWKK